MLVTNARDGAQLTLQLATRHLESEIVSIAGKTLRLASFHVKRTLKARLTGLLSGTHQRTSLIISDGVDV